MNAAPSPIALHSAATDLAVELNKSSKAKYENTSNDIVRDALFVLSHDGVCVHRAIGKLVEAGWSSPGAALARTLFDIWISVGAVVRSAKPALAAFKYLYSGHNRLSRDAAYPSSMRASLRKEIHDRISSLPAADRDDALQAVGDKDRSYWFNPEWASPSAVAAVLGSEELELAWTYVQLSAAAHGAFFGMRLFRDRPDEFSVNPRIPPGKTAYSVALLSARFIVEISARRDEYEGLGMASDCDTIRRLLNVMATSR